METKTAFAIVLLICAAPTAAAFPVPLPYACGGTVTGCADILDPLVKPSALVPALAPPAPEPASAAPPVPAAGEPTPDATAPPADAAERQDAASSADAAAAPTAPLDARVLLLALAAVAALALVLFVMLLASRARRGPNAATVRELARARAMQEGIDRAWREARPDAKRAQ